MQTYDFIVVGSGSAGSVVAERLSANGRYSVLVLEAGGSDRRFYVQMPLGYGKTFFDPAVNWNYRAEPDPGLAGNADHWPRGKILGGSSSINAMVWIRGHPADYDAWAAAGNPGWGFADLLPAFKAIEDNEAGADDLRGVGGPLHVTDCSRASPPDDGALPQGRRRRPGCRSIRISTALPGRRRHLPDLDQGRPPHVGCPRLPAPGHEAEERPRRDERAGDQNRLRRQSRRRHRISAQWPDGERARRPRNRSCAAARSTRRSFCNSPASVPPASCKISASRSSTPTAMSAPTCRTMSASTTPSRPASRRSTRSFGHGGASCMSACNISCTRSGPLSLSMNNAGGFFRTDPSLARPNMQLYFQAFSTVIPKTGERPILTPDPWPGFSIGLSNCRPSSRGEIMIRSKNPLDYPKIVPNAFSTERRRRRDAGGREIPAQDRLHAGDGRSHRRRGFAWSVNNFRRGS